MMKNELATIHATVTYEDSTWIIVTAPKSAVERDRESVRKKLSRLYHDLGMVTLLPPLVEFEDETADFVEE